ncbi:MAG: DNA repair exonuclease [Pirellulales bacterium]|nr:DNA repair exonuclease [Pirellulales bacterium]
MSQQPLRFLQAGDFHLERPLSGVEEVPDAWRELFLEAPYRAAARVFDAAVMEGVQFVVLTGDLLDPVLTGPRGPVFLTEQFSRLAEREIPVYWSGGTVDPPEAWPVAWPLPGNVHVFSRGRIDEFLYQRDGVPAARLIGTSRHGESPIRPGEFLADGSGLFTIAAAHGSAELSALQARGINFWALGGRHERQTPAAAPAMIHYCGSPQGRHPGETGVHGCTLVEVDEQRQVRTSFIPTDAVRWFDECLAVDKSTTADDLQARLRQRLTALRQAESGVDLLICWTVSGGGPVLGELRRDRLARDVLEQLRSEGGGARPAAWSVALRVRPNAVLPAKWYEEENLRGDFLRILREWQVNPEMPLGLETYLGPGGPESRDDLPDREQMLCEAAILGVELLGGGVEDYDSE